MINAAVTKAVLEAWVDNFAVDVPAKHQGGEYLIDIRELENHIHNLDYEDLVDIMLETEENYL